MVFVCCTRPSGTNGAAISPDGEPNLVGGVWDRGPKDLESVSRDIFQESDLLRSHLDAV